MNDTQQTIENYLALMRDTIDKLDRKQIEKTIEAFMRVYESGNTIYIFGNGGSKALPRPLMPPVTW